MKTKCWLIINGNGSVRVTKNKPSAGINEISINLDIYLPDALFHKPKLIASITVPDEAAIPEIVNAQVVDTIQETIRINTGLDFQISISDPEKL